MKPTTSAERKRAQREREKAAGLVRRDVLAHPDDWEQIRELEQKLKEARKKSCAT
tara:strand:- start:59 stop:223 length:165 start_codon:yes stop_codon:yes gene_type:complete